MGMQEAAGTWAAQGLEAEPKVGMTGPATGREESRGGWEVGMDRAEAARAV